MTAIERLTRADLRDLLTVTRALAAPFELGEMLREVTQAACRVLHAERSSVWLAEASGEALVLEVASDVDHIRLPIGRGLVGACARDRRPINVPDCYADPRFDPAVDRRTGFHTRCSLTLPLVLHDETFIGVMQVLNRRDGDVFDDDDEALALALAAQCAVALDRARATQAMLEGRQLRHEIALARDVQQATLPQTLPTAAGYALHALFRPAALTGGDAYDAVRVGNELLLVLADAAGHGLGPALLVTQLQAMLRTAFSLGAALDTAFCTINDRLVELSRDGGFVTAFVGLLDVERHCLRYQSGGQAPILHWHADTARFERLRATSFPLGAATLDAAPAPRTLVLAPGDAVALLSDGVFEAENSAGAPFGIERAEQVLADAFVRGCTVGDAGAALQQAVDRYAGTHPQQDDVTMLIVHRCHPNDVPLT